MIVAVVFDFAVLMLSTGNALVSVYCTLAIVGVFAGVVAVM